jgi:hypothetical protein
MLANFGIGTLAIDGRRRNLRDKDCLARNDSEWKRPTEDRLSHRPRSLGASRSILSAFMTRLCIR